MLCPAEAGPSRLLAITLGRDLSGEGLLDPYGCDETLEGLRRCLGQE